jgi:poly-gamma-glutamate synthesis protein (capsule biosynthesis protein)
MKKNAIYYCVWILITTTFFLLCFILLGGADTSGTSTVEQSVNPITIFLGGDVMVGRGIDQVLPNPSDPILHEPFMRSARGYVDIAEAMNGPIPKPVSFSYIWGDALEEWARTKPDLKLVNLETSVTKSEDYGEGKSIHYRLHPKNISVIAKAGIDFCALANNHILDWGYSGLTETMDTLKEIDVKFAGAGLSLEEAEAPVVLELEGMGRVIVFSFGTATSGIPQSWAASSDSPGVNFLRNFSDRTIRRIREQVLKVKREGDIVIASIHWGSNCGYAIPNEQVEFAHNLIDRAGVDLIHGHSSHHARPIEVYRDKLILYGSGDFINDYEGIGGYDAYRGDLVLLYAVYIDLSSGNLIGMRMVPFQIRQFRLNRAEREDALWLRNTLNSEGEKFGTGVEINDDGTLRLIWDR